MYQLRDYQQKASDSALAFFRKKNSTNGLIVLPTGSGKSLVIADIADRLDDDLLILQPSKEILEQNFAKLQSYGYLFCSIYSASCGSKEINRVTFATIGSIKNKIDEFRHFKYCIIDECHLVNPNQGMYSTFLKAIGAKCVGLTATPYRLYSNSLGSELRFLTRVRPRFFKEVINYVQVGELLNRGYLSKMNYYDLLSIDISRLKTNSTGADFTDRSVIEEYKRSGFYRKLVNVVDRLLYNAKVPRKGVLVFTRFIEEADNLAKAIKGCEILTGETPKREREDILRRFKSGEIRVVANVGTLTTGFDYPELDTIVMARPTKSLSLWYQIVGRAIRPHKDKISWVVDLCGTYRDFGPVDGLRMIDTGNGKWVIKNGNKQLTNICRQ